MNKIDQTQYILFLNLLMLNSSSKKKLYSTEEKSTRKNSQLGPVSASLLDLVTAPLTFGEKSNLITCYWITGFADAESSFVVCLSKSKTTKLGWSINLSFSIEVNSKDTFNLNKIKAFFGIGNIYVRGRNNQAIYTVKSIKDITNVIIPHFNKYSLLTKKQIDFEIFKQIVALMNEIEHLTSQGLQKIVNIIV